MTPLWRSEALDSDDDVEILNYGRLAEERALHHAARGGQPDFVFRPTNVVKGTAQREIGDALIWTGERMLVVSVKSRDPARKGLDAEARARSWLDKKIAAACRQIDGTVRTLRGDSADVTLTNLRGVSIPWDASQVREWLGAVVIDYTPPPSYVPNPTCSQVPAVVLHADDWRVINETLWSSTLTIGYVNTRRQLPPVPMGAELDLLGHVLEAEQQLRPIALPGGQPQPGKWQEVRLRWPDFAMRSHPDSQYALLLDAIMGAMAEASLEPSAALHPLEYVGLVRLLDEIPLLERVEMGRECLDRCKRAASTKSRVSYLSWPTRGRLGLQILFVADSASREERKGVLAVQAMTRHAELLAATDNASLTTLGIATEPFPASGGSHDFALLAGDIGLSQASLDAGEAMFPKPQFPAEVLDNIRSLGDGTMGLMDSS